LGTPAGKILKIRNDARPRVPLDHRNDRQMLDLGAGQSLSDDGTEFA